MRSTEREQMEVNNAMFTAGELGGLCFKFNIPVMEKFLQECKDGKHPDFRYPKLCQAAVDFAKVVQNVR